jgi:UDP-N-acetyl-D-glucosamine dehydrogenase
MREHSFDLSSVDPTPENIAQYDVLLIATNHSAFDYKMFQEKAQLIIDTRGVYSQTANNIIKA